jgi:hypothetical protein
MNTQHDYQLLDTLNRDHMGWDCKDLVDVLSAMKCFEIFVLKGKQISAYDLLFWQVHSNFVEGFQLNPQSRDNLECDLLQHILH